MINELPLEPFYTPEQSALFDLINNLDSDRLDLMSPIDILILIETEIQ